MPRQYITTAIDFPNAAPHMGHVMEKVLADVVARWFRLRGDETFYQIGTDDHGIKMQRTAEGMDMHPADLVKQNAPIFQDLFDRLNISYDFFISTSITEGHYDTVQALWRKLQKNGHLEKRSYTGLYCSGCERFMTKRDLEDGVCPNHKVAPEEISEENWFFDLTKHSDYLRSLLDLDSGSYIIYPDYRAKEVFAFLDQGLEDVSFSRPKSTLHWGVPVPDDEEQVMYVWCDNLTNYISSHKYLTDAQDSTWWDDAEITHVIGKDISRFHALNWPAMLHCADVKTPDHLIVHGFLTSEGEKMSKSTGNVVVPDEVLEKFDGNPDPIRFYLSHEIPVGRDGDFSWKRYEELYDAKLRNALGNLLNRVLMLLKSEGGELQIPESESDAKEAAEGWKRYSEAMDSFDLQAGIQQAMQLVDALNGAIDSSKPWTLEGKEKVELLSRFAESLRHIALLLLPFTPETAKRMSQQLGVPYADSVTSKDFVITEEMRTFGGQKDWKSIGEPSILFAPLG